jgi:hypothetical protein
MPRILALFDTKSHATAALDQIYQLFDNDDDIDVRIYDSDDLDGTRGGVLGGIVMPAGSSEGRGVIPVTGGPSLNQDEQRFFTDRMGDDSVFTVIRAKKDRDQKILQIIRMNNGQVYEEHK